MGRVSVSLPAPWWGLVRVDASCKILTPSLMGKKCEKLQAERLCCIDLVKQMLGQPSALPAAHLAVYIGSRTIKVDPCATRLSTVTDPPWALTIQSTIANPSPLLPSSVLFLTESTR